MKKKLAFIMMIIMLALFALGAMLIYIARNNGEEYEHIVLAQQNYDSSVILAERGDILDRNNTVLATNEVVYNLILDPAVILSEVSGVQVYHENTVGALVSVFGYDKDELEDVLKDNAESRYVRFEKEIHQEEKEAFDALVDEGEKKYEKSGLLSDRIRGVWFEREYKRVYPYDSLACTLLGYASSDGSAGNWGIEQYYNDELVGTNGKEYGYMDSNLNLERVTKDPVDGNTVVSTIDFHVQTEVERCIAEYMKEIGGADVGVVVMDPRNAEILAMATDDVMNCNDPTDLTGYYTDSEIKKMNEDEFIDAVSSHWRNLCISDTYEPGSTVKAFTVSTVLEENVVDRDDYSFVCDGENQVGVFTIHCNATHGFVNLEQSLMYSCNDVMMDLAFRMGAHTFSEYQKIFGFGQATGIDLPGEASAEGLLHEEESMGSADLATNAFGQNYNVTMIQVAAAYCSVLNGGNYYEPHVLKRVLNASGNAEYEKEPVLVRQTVSEETSEWIRHALFNTVEAGTGSPAQVAGYEVGGKTGTAEKYPRSEDNYLVSFIGFAPVDDPQVLVYVIVNEPAAENQAQSYFASTLEQKIMSSILPYLNIYPTREVTQTTAEQAKTTEASPEGETNNGDDTGEVPDNENGEEDPNSSNDSEEPEGNTESQPDLDNPQPVYSEDYDNGIF